MMMMASEESPFGTCAGCGEAKALVEECADAKCRKRFCRACAPKMLSVYEIRAYEGLTAEDIDTWRAPWAPIDPESEKVCAESKISIDAAMDRYAAREREVKAKKVGV